MTKISTKFDRETVWLSIDQTVAEVIYTRADAEKEFMGLTTFKGNCTHKQAVDKATNELKNIKQELSVT